jgi:phenylacetate-CoA ligase
VVYKGCHDYLGVLPLTTGSGVVTASTRQLEIAFAWGTNLWVSFPEYLIHLAHVARDELGRDVRDLKTKFLSTYLGPDLSGALRREVEDLWGCPVYDNYGTNEVGLGAFECSHKCGLHLMEDTAFFEIVDPETGVPVQAGSSGNLVVTLFHRGILPIVRYNLRDLARFVADGECACGSHFRRMDHFLGRSDDMIKLRGVNLYPMACLTAIKSDPRTTGEWVCIVERVETGRAPRDEMVVQVEVRQEVTDTEGLKQILEQRLQADLGVKVDVELVQEGALRDLANLGREGKPRRLVDRRYPEAG